MYAVVIGAADAFRRLQNGIQPILILILGCPLIWHRLARDQAAFRANILKSRIRIETIQGNWNDFAPALWTLFHNKRTSLRIGAAYVCDANVTVGNVAAL